MTVAKPKPNTKEQYQQVLDHCRTIFLKKNSDYGASWRLFRPSSLTDQLFIKAQRIRNIEQSGVNNVGDDVFGEFMGIVNYAIMGMIQMNEEATFTPTESTHELMELYDLWSKKTFDLMLLKNSDYSEVWREMRISSFTDMILVKLARIKQIEDNQGITVSSEGADANYQDIMNYAIFALIRLTESKTE